MEYKTLILTLVYLFAAFLYTFFGVSIFGMDPKKRINKIGLAVCTALFIWTFGKAMACSASNSENALFWMRFSAIGKMSAFSTVLHFVLLSANKEASVKQLKRFSLVYIPTIIYIYIFMISKTLAPIQYNLIKMDFGWINMNVNTVWTFLYKIYYVLYTIFSLIIICKWKIKISNKTVAKQINLLLITSVGVFIIGTFYDLIYSSIAKGSLPKISPIIAVFPVWALYYSIKYQNLLDLNLVEKKEIILSDVQQKKIHRIFAIGLCLGGVLQFFSEYFSKATDGSGDIKTSLIKSAIIIILGFCIFLFQKIKNDYYRNASIKAVLLASIPIIAFEFVNYSNITTWVYPIVIIISALLFNKPYFLTVTTIIAIVTQAIVWRLKPESYVLVDKFDYIGRIAVIGIVFLLGLYVNKIYIAKIREHERQKEFEKMESQILLDLVSLNQENFDEKTDNLLKSISNFFKVDRTYFFTINQQENTVSYSNAWCNLHKEFKDIILDSYSWWIEKMKKNEIIYIENVEQISDDANFDKTIFLTPNVKTIIVIPVFIDDKLQGVFGLESIITIKKWSPEDINQLKTISNFLSSGIKQVNYYKIIEFMAYNDDLTKLPNRISFVNKLNREISACKNTEKLIAVTGIDIDSFSLIQDTLGHIGGDTLLKEIAVGLVNKLHKTDMVARFSGDKFMVMVTNITDHNMLYKRIDAIMELFTNAFRVNNQEYLVTASAGTAIYPIDGEDAETLIKNAGIAIHTAKSKGKNQHLLCTDEMKNQIKEEMSLSNELQYAVSRNELILHYQPQINIITNKITGVEALVRWMHPTKNMIAPSVFIPLAERNGLIDEIGEWVLRTACIQSKKWQEMGLTAIDMAVNLSAVQIINPNIAERIEKIIKKVGVDPKNIELEITESVAINETQYLIDVLSKIHKIGVSIAIDDFGTKYSSLNRLQELPVERIKIDKQFIQAIEANEKDRAITVAIINLVKKLGLNVLAEGVETQTQLDILKKAHCDYVQGYYFYKPMPAEEIEKLLRKFPNGKI